MAALQALAMLTLGGVLSIVVYVAAAVVLLFFLLALDALHRYDGLQRLVDASQGHSFTVAGRPILPIRFMEALTPRWVRERLLPLDIDRIAGQVRRDELLEHETGPAERCFLSDNEQRRLRLLERVLSDSPSLGVFGRLAFRHDVHRILTNRVRLEKLMRHYGTEIKRERIDAPVFILGLPRTGTTFLQRLLTEDPRFRSLRMWEGNYPVPDLVEAQEFSGNDRSARGKLTRETFRSSPRFAEQEWGRRMFHLAAPFTRSIHDIDSASAEEDIMLLHHSIASTQSLVLYDVWEFWEELQVMDVREWDEAFAVHKRLLQVLQWQQPGSRQWLLKSPQHLFFGSLRHLIRTYPDAKFIWTHRNPREVVASVVSLTANFRSIDYDVIDVDSLSDRWPECLADSLRQGLAARRLSEHSNRFVDVRYEDLVADPVGTVDSVYRSLGLSPLDGAGRGAMQSFLSRDRRASRKKHDYSLEQFGITDDRMDRLFADYVRDFCAPPPE